MKAESSRFLSNLRLCAALLVAAGFSDIGKASTWRRFYSAFALWLGLLRDRGPFADDALYGRRLRACRACPLYYRPLGTCGSPLRKELEDLGCWCYMKTAAKLLRKTCWLDDNCEPGNPNGWTANGCSGAGDRDTAGAGATGN